MKTAYFDKAFFIFAILFEQILIKGRNLYFTF
jgi:hypothetical protein